MRSAFLARLKRLETVQAVEDSNRRLKVEFAYLKLLLREYSGPRHIVSVSQRPDGRCDWKSGRARRHPIRAEATTRT
jgi:hypothetical protein